MNWPQLLSKKRLGDPGHNSSVRQRSDFQRDYDRIIFSSAFRRLQDKTQVFPLSQNDYVRTRLTHSLEVSSVGRSLGAGVGEVLIARHRLAELQVQDFATVVAAACLAHDIGNPPFGHAGEDAIRDWFCCSSEGKQALAELSAEQQQDFINFEGNAQGFRLLTRLQSPDNHGGMQLTCATLGTVSKYPRASALTDAVPPGAGLRKYGFFQAEQTLFKQLAAVLDLTPVVANAWHRHPLAYLVEAADDICYRIIDIEDAFRLRILSYVQAEALLLPLATQQTGRLRLAEIRHDKEKIEYLRAKAIAVLVQQLVDFFLTAETDILVGKQHLPLINCIPAADLLVALLSEAEQQVYVAPPVIEVGVAGFKVLSVLLDAFFAAVNDIANAADGASPKNKMLFRLIPGQFIATHRLPQPDAYQRLLGITDFISGMTDTFALNLYRRITGIDLPK